jgi:ubiquinone/menaquinone biosynthesis C-methylase UbiE
MRITRKVMYEELRQLRLKGSACSISHSSYLLKNELGIETFDELNFPKHDWCDLKEVENDRYDILAADQVLEHVQNPQRAFDETARILRKDGIAVITSCFINPYHPSPNDYWRFTEDGLRLLAKNSNLQVLHVGSWGNKVITPIILLRSKWRGTWNSWIVKKLRKFDNSSVAITNWIVVKK